MRVTLFIVDASEDPVLWQQSLKEARGSLDVVLVYVHDVPSFPLIGEVIALTPARKAIIITGSLSVYQLATVIGFEEQSLIHEQAQLWQLLRAIQTVTQGHDYLDPLFADVHRFRCAAQILVLKFTDRQLEILRLVASAYSNKEIADILKISLETVKTHVRSVLLKIGVKSRIGAARFAWENGFMDR